MKVGLVGSGGREHALAAELVKNKTITKLYCFPGNGGTADIAQNVPIGAMELEKIKAFALEEGIEYMVVAPDDPLAAGLVDLLEAAGIPCFGPRKGAAQVEASKVFAKEFMTRHNIPTAPYKVFTEYEEALSYLKTQSYPIVLKADGLALGKGVIIPADFEEAKVALTSMMQDKIFGASADRVLIEECLTGPEVSVLCFADGETVVPMVASMDHKRIFEGDKGPNTGGMGVIAPNPFYTPEVARRTKEEILIPTIRGLKEEGIPFKGCLYFGLMITADGPKVIEYNARFGDPETQVVLPLLKSDLFTVMQKCTAGKLKKEDVVFMDGACACVVMASGGYPGSYEKNKPIDFGGFEPAEDLRIYHAGTAGTETGYATSGGRVLAVSATAPTLPEALQKAYGGVENITFEGAYYRRDIGAKALSILNEQEAK